MSSALNSVPLSSDDHRVLAQRGRIVATIAKWISGIVGFGIVLLIAKDFFVYREFQIESFYQYLRFAALFGLSIGAVYALLTWHERRVREELRADLRGGIKIKKFGTLHRIEESAESEPVRLWFSEAGTDSQEEFALRTFSDLKRIKPHSLVGKNVEIEYAPNSRVVLRLHQQT